MKENINQQDVYDITIFDEVIEYSSMPFSDILQKLLPFTHKTENGVDFSLLNLSTGDIIITTIELLLITLFTFHIFKLFSLFKRDKQTITNIKSSIYKYGNDIESICAKAHSKKISRVWNNFYKSLINKSNQTSTSEYFFNNNLLYINHNKSFFYALPGIILSIGLLGTFFALYVALIELELNDDNIKQSIKNFIELIGTKFTASVWGLFLSILFNYTHKKIEQNLSNEIIYIQDLIDKEFPITRPEDTLYNIELENRKQTDLLKELANK